MAITPEISMHAKLSSRSRTWRCDAENLRRVDLEQQIELALREAVAAQNLGDIRKRIRLERRADLTGVARYECVFRARGPNRTDVPLDRLGRGIRQSKLRG